MHTIIASVSACRVKKVSGWYGEDFNNVLIDATYSRLFKKWLSYVSFSTALVCIHELTKLLFFVWKSFRLEDRKKKVVK
jgi:hypothetical protein